MIEVYPCGNGFRWRLISAEGRTLFEHNEVYPCSHQANRIANAYRQALWCVAENIDHRQARCI